MVSLPARCSALSREAASGKVLIPRTTKRYAPGLKSLPREKETTYLVVHLPQIRHRSKKTDAPQDERKKTSHPPCSRNRKTRTFIPRRTKAPTLTGNRTRAKETYAHLVTTYLTQTQARATHAPRHRSREEEDKMGGQRPHLVWCFVPLSVVDQPGGRPNVSLLVMPRSPRRFGLPV